MEISCLDVAIIDTIARIAITVITVKIEYFNFPAGCAYLLRILLMDSNAVEFAMKKRSWVFAIKSLITLFVGTTAATADAISVLEQDVTKVIIDLSIIKDILILIDLFQIDIAVITASATIANGSFSDFIIISIRLTRNALKLIVIITITTAVECSQDHIYPIVIIIKVKPLLCCCCLEY